MVNNLINGQPWRRPPFVILKGGARRCAVRPDQHSILSRKVSYLASAFPHA